MADGSGGAPLQNLLGRSLLRLPRLYAPPTSACRLALPLPAEVVLPSAVGCKPLRILRLRFRLTLLRSVPTNQLVHFITQVSFWTVLDVSPLSDLS